MEVWSGRSRKSLEGAMRVARELRQGVSTAHILYAIAEAGSAAGKLLQNRGATPDQIRARLKRESALEVTLEITIDDASDQQIYDQIVSQVREAVATSKLKPGDRLPAIRRLADQLGIAPGTVARAYAELETAQVIITDGPKGTYVAEPPLPTPPSVRPIAMRDLFRPVVVAAFHLGASAGELRKALEEAMTDIYPGQQPRV
jgi:GntR family transcriptional regulator